MKFIVKITLKIAGLVITLSVLFAAFTVIIERANSEYTENGAYSSELLTWEQDHPGTGTLKVFGKSVPLNLDALSDAKSNLETGAKTLFSFLPETVRTTAAKIWTTVTATSEALLKLVF